jgi:hypothetical protein
VVPDDDRPYLVLAWRQLRPPRSRTPTAVTYATITPTYAPGNRTQKPTSGCGKFWKPMPCYVTRTVAPPTTALIPPTKTPVQSRYQ